MKRSISRKEDKKQKLGMLPIEFKLRFRQIVWTKKTELPDQILRDARAETTYQRGRAALASPCAKQFRDNIESVTAFDEEDELASDMRRDLRALFSSLAQRFSKPNLSLFRARCWRQVVSPPEVKSQEKPFRCGCWTAAGIDVEGNSRNTEEGWPMKFTPRTWEALPAFSSSHHDGGDERVPGKVCFFCALRIERFHAGKSTRAQMLTESTETNRSPALMI